MALIRAAYPVKAMVVVYVSVPERGFVALIGYMAAWTGAGMPEALRFSPRAGIRGFDIDLH